MSTSTSASPIEWEYLDGVPNVVLVAREHGRALALIEMCPRAGFRLTDCRSGAVRTFISLEDAQQAFLSGLSHTSG